MSLNSLYALVTAAEMARAGHPGIDEITALWDALYYAMDMLDPEPPETREAYEPVDTFDHETAHFERFGRPAFPNEY